MPSPDTFIPPAAVAEQAALGLELRRKFGRGGTNIGARRAGQLSGRERVSLDVVRRMVSYFARHEGDRAADGWRDPKDPSPGWIAWLLWGGDPGRAWAKEILGSVEKDLDEAGSICVAVLLPPDLARRFPPPEAPGVDRPMPPHITVLYCETDRARLALAEQVVRDVAALSPPVDVEIGGLGYFDLPDSRVAYVAVRSAGLVELHGQLLLGLRSVGIGADQTHPEYVPHATLAYLEPGAEFSGDVPAGQFTAMILAVWVMGDPSTFARLSASEGAPDGVAWPMDLARGDVDPDWFSKWDVHPHIRPDIHFAGGGNVDNVVKSLDELVDKASALGADQRKELAGKLDEAAAKLRKGSDAAAAEAAAAEEAEKEKARKEAEEKAKAEKAALEKAANSWPSDMAAG